MQGELDLRERTWGGRREGAGRKRKPGKREPAHRARPEHKKRYPVHVSLRVVEDVGRLRRRNIYAAVRASLIARGVSGADDGGFRVVHVSIQHNHVHLLVEAGSKQALSNGMRVLTITLARAINSSLGRSGKVFAFRYHATTITTPAQTRNALAYVLNNWRRHREDVLRPGSENMMVDPYSTAISFRGWRVGTELGAPADDDPLPSAEPATWFLRVGWRAHGELDAREVPGRLR